MQTIAWQQDGELTQTVPWFSFNDAALRATIADLMQHPGVRSVSFLEPRAQLLVRYDRAVTSADEIRSGALGGSVLPKNAAVDDAMRWAPTAGKLLLKLASAMAR
jgi:hypothetical protein